MAVLHPQGPVGNQEARLITTSALLMCLIVLPVFFLTFFVAWRYRAGAKHSDYAPDWSYSIGLDIAVWTAPLLIVTALAILCWRSTLALDPYRPRPGLAPQMVVEVVALDWKWLFIYPAQGIASVNQLVIPAGTQVDFQITSESVMNVFFIPQLGTQIYAMSGMVTQDHLLAKNTGTFRGFSANFSGPGFADMRFATIATDQAGFAAWVKRLQAAPGRLDDKTYQMLAGPSVNLRASGFGQVKPGLFGDILAAHGGAARRMPQEETE